MKAACIDKAPHLGENFAARDKRRAHLGIDDEIDVTLAIALLDILESMPFIGKRCEPLTQHGNRRCMQRQFTHLRAEEIALDSDDIAAFDVRERFEVLVAQFVTTCVDLEFVRACIAEIEE